MKTDLEAGIEGSVISYRIEEGWGFLRRPEEDDVFFHVRNLLCTAPYNGETLVFDIGESSSPSHEYEAVRVRRPPAPSTKGDVLEWYVEPGTWRTEGRIVPSSGGPSVPFSKPDLKLGAKGYPPNPRPWHAATYRVVETGEGPRAVDIELDVRYPLKRFAYLGDETDMLRSLKAMALPETWDYQDDPSDRESPLLYSYLHFTFARLRDEDRELDADSRKIRVRDDLPLPLAVFNTGLVDHKYKSIYALFERNDPGYFEEWKFRAFCIPGEGHGKVVASYFNPLPRPAEYFHSTTELLFDPEAPLHPDYTHILTQNRDRLPLELLEQVKALGDSMIMRTLTMYLDEAINVAKKRALWNYKTAIPHYFPSFKRLEFLLPLCLVKDDRVDVALSVQKTDTGYQANTILPLDWAYKSARLVCRPDSDWLAPEQIEVAADESELEDGE